MQDTDLADIYAQLVAEDMKADGILDSSCQALAISLFGETIDGEEIVGTAEVDLFFSGEALRQLLDELAMAGVL